MMFFRTQRFAIFGLVLFLGVLLVAKFVAPLYLRAQTNSGSVGVTADLGGDNVGSNVGEGDITTQVDIIHNVIAKNGAGAGYPVTVLMYEDSQPADVQKVADAIKSHGFFPIVRIDHTCDHTTGDSQKIVGLVKQAFGPDTVIAFGNEINNGDIECKNWHTYEQNYLSVRGGSNISPSAIDFYMGNPAYTFDKLPGSLQSIINGAGVRAANAYGCIGATAASCDDNAMGTYKTGLTGTDGKQLYVTEFSLSPGKRDASAPDTDLVKVIQFIQKYAPQLHAQKITPLIRNVCNSDGDWLIYVKGQVFTKHGLNVTKGCKSTLVPYYEFNIQRESTQKILSNFTDEYSVACLPKEEYTIGFENTEKCDKPGVYCPSDWKSWNIPGVLSLTADGKSYGLYRDEEKVKSRIVSNAPTTRVESIESYLSMPNQNPLATPNPSSPPSAQDKANTQAPLYSLTSLDQQCDFVVKKLKAVEYLCKPENRVDLYSTPGVVSPQASDVECGLNTTVPGTSKPYDQKKMLADFNQKNKTCKELVASQDTGDQTFLADLLRVNISMETAYRPAFIVAVTTFDDPNSQDNVTSNSGQDLPNPVSSKFQVVDYLEVKIPAIATDFLPPESTTHTSDQMTPDRNSYADPIKLTANALRTVTDQEKFAQQEIADRDKLRATVNSIMAGSAGAGKIIGNNSAYPIFCNVNGQLVADCNVPSGGSGPDYKDQIPQALVKFINANAGQHTQWDALPCQSGEVDIYDKKNTEHIAEQAKTIIAHLKAEKLGPYDKKTSIGTKITIGVKDVTKGGNITTSTELYFVTPQRYELQWAQQSFKTLLNTAQQDSIASGNPQETAKVNQVAEGVADPNKFSPLLRSELAKTLTGLERKPAFELINDTPSVNPLTPPGAPNRHDFELRGLVLDTSDFPDKQSIFWRVAGQVASLPTRMMALLTTSAGSLVNDYTLGCTGNFATEEWLTGKCLKAKPVEQASSGNVPGTTSNVCIETKISDPLTLATYATQLKGYLAQPSTKDLWYRYYEGYQRGGIEYLFETNAVCDGVSNRPCYEHVIDTAVAHHINPYLAIAIALNEDGGLKTINAQALGPHFGCGWSEAQKKITDGPIGAKLSCMVGAFDDFETKGMNADAALRKYGYAGGIKNGNLTKIIGMISLHTYAGSCTNTDPAADPGPRP